MTHKLSNQLIIERLNQNKNGNAEGVYSICSANRFVIETGMLKAKNIGQPVLIEATCNQVNQFGGYTGMTPAKFTSFIFEVADKCQFPHSQVIFGGDHLGPYPWRKLPVQTAMEYSEQMIHDFVMAGYTKIHIDTSMRCEDDEKTQPLSDQTSAERAVQLCKIAEQTAEETNGIKPFYVIGTEVPLPGGQQEITNEIEVTKVEYITDTLQIFRETFQKNGLDSAWSRVRAVVVQPGVEFGENGIIDYQQKKAKPLKKFIEHKPDIVYEAHSTDFQRKSNLKRMVEDHFAILKVGPALTFHFREAVIALEKIEDELYKKGTTECMLSNLTQTILKEMDKYPADWKNYYSSDDSQEMNKLFGFSDRIRYYWNLPAVERALEVLINNLQIKPIPLSLLSQYLPTQFIHIRDQELEMDAEQIIRDHIGEVIDDYIYACAY